MDAFLTLAYELVWKILSNIASFFVTIGKALLGIFTAFKDYFKIVVDYSKGFNFAQWALTAILILALVGILALILYKVVLMLRKRWHHKRAALESEDLLEEIAVLNDKVADLVTEKSKILAMKVSQLGLSPDDDGTPSDSGSAQGDKKVYEPRFPKLMQVDEAYADYEAPAWNDEITLAGIVEGYRNYAAGKLGLFYNDETVRLYLSGLAASKLIILEGISGTGKTSLPYSFSRYLNNPCGIVSVQPSYRDKTELLGYFNEFTKRFNETEFLRNLYAASYHDDINFIVLDELNLARIEYYFAEMLSVMEMPSADEWVVDLVPIGWENDPKHIQNGRISVPENLWFIGTANNDDSTFTITDKVYDRAIPIELNRRADSFTAPPCEPLNLSWEHLKLLFTTARTANPISEQAIEKLTKLDNYLQTHFKLAFGNRITKQMHAFVPVYVGCGGTENDGMDYIIRCKILKKFESTNVSFIQDDMRDLITFMEKTFGKTALHSSRQYIQKLQTMF